MSWLSISFEQSARGLPSLMLCATETPGVIFITSLMIFDTGFSGVSATQGSERRPRADGEMDSFCKVDPSTQSLNKIMCFVD